MAKQTTPAKNTRSSGPPPKTGGSINSDSKALAARAQASGGAVMSAADAALMAEDARAGMENIGTRDLAIPRAKLLQDLSPECKKREDTYIPDAEAGDIYDSVNGILIKGDVGFEAILVAYRSSYLEFIPRAKGGGFVADHGANPAALLSKVQKGDKSEIFTPGGNELVLTGEYLALILDEETGGHKMSLLGMAKSQLRHSRQLNTWITTLKVPDGQGATFTPGMFYRTYIFKTAPERNKKNDTWMGWVIEPGRVVLGLPAPFDGRALYLSCRDIRKDFEANKIKVQAPAAPEEQPNGGGSDEPM